MDSKLLMLLKEYGSKKAAVKEAKQAYASFTDFDNEDAFEEIKERFFNAQTERDYVANTICNYLLSKEDSYKCF